MSLERPPAGHPLPGRERPRPMRCRACGRELASDFHGATCPHCGRPTTASETAIQGSTMSLAEGSDDGEETWVGREIASCRIVGRLGKGGMGRVYLAHHPGLNKLVAIKVLDRVHARNSEVVERFIREAQAAARLEHANVVQILHAGRDGENDFIVMQHVEGESLAEILERRGALEVDEVLRIAVGIARALAAAHALGIVHRDIKPANVLLTEQGAIKVTDFGLARDQSTPSDLTMAGRAYGTPPYMSPEQIGGRRVDERSDLYSFGVLLYECLSGRRPFEAEHFTGYAELHRQSEAARLARVVPGIDPELDHLVHQLLAKAPEDRYASAEELLADLALLAGVDPDLRDDHGERETRRRTLAPSGTARLQHLLSQAVQDGATDLHLEPLAQRWRVRARIRGKLTELESLSTAAGRAVIEACRSLAALVTDDLEPQDGIVEFPHEDHVRHAKLSLMPTRFGPRAALRLLGLVHPHPHLARSGFLDEHFARLTHWLGERRGLIVVAGPAGSGKGNVIGGLLGHYDLGHKVAIAIAGDSLVDSDDIGQIQISHKLTRAAAVQSALHQDPDLLLLLDVHGMPDRDTANAALRAVADDKLVLASVTADTAADAIEDLLAMSLSPKILSRGVVGVLCLRLIRRVCPQCAEDYQPEPRVRALLPPELQDAPAKRGRGCNHCQQRGFLGRSLIYDFFEPDLEFWSDLGEETREREIARIAQAHGLVTMPAIAAQRVAEGVIDPADLLTWLPGLYRPRRPGEETSRLAL